MTQIIKNIATWATIRANISKDRTQTLGLVMTMGNLHQGHVSLLKQCKCDNNISVLSIFINPTQFNNPQDLANYPKTQSADIKLAQDLKIDFVLIFDKSELYPDHYNYKIQATSKISQIMEGESRPGHFASMLTIVTKMHNLVLPNKSYFGEKDYQQYILVKETLEAFLINTEVIGCPIIRDKNNLALSSRNNLLTAAQLKVAALFPKYLHDKTLDNQQIKDKLTAAKFKIDYIQTIDKHRFGAVYLGKIRLIDNIKL